jgi:hypothetical protein
MKSLAMRFTLSLILCQPFVAHPVRGQTLNGEAQTNHSLKIRESSKQLHWQNGPGHERYDAVKETVTQSVFDEVDGYITETYSAAVTPEQVKAGIDTLMGRKDGDDLGDFAFSTNLPSGKFMIVGIELPRGGPAISEDAIAFRAYGTVGNKLKFIASTGNLSQSEYLVSLRAKALPASPVPGEFWFMAWADVPPLSPYQIAVRLYAFNGKSFRTVWSPENIISPNIDDAVQVGPNGRVTINRLPVWDSQTVLHDQYTVTAGGLKKVAETTTDLE